MAVMRRWRVWWARSRIRLIASGRPGVCCGRSPIDSELPSRPIFDKLAAARSSRGKRFPKDAVVFFENEAGDTLFMVAEGRIKVTILGDDGREVILSVLGAGEFFGDMSLLDNEPRSATAIAAEDSELLSLSRADFEGLMKENPGIMTTLIRVLTARLRHANHQISTLALLDVYGRVARVIVDLARDDGRRLKDGRIAFQRPTHQEIANRIGTTRETVTRMLKDLQRQGLIKVSGKEIVVEQDFERAFDYGPSRGRFFDRDLDLARATVARDGDAERRPDFRGRQLAAEAGGVGYRLAVHRHHHVARLQPRAVRGRAAQDLVDERARGLLQAERRRRLLVDRPDLGDADPAAHHAAVADQLIHHLARQVGGHREADALVAAGLGVDRGVDADQLARGC